MMLTFTSVIQPRPSQHYQESRTGHNMPFVAMEHTNICLKECIEFV